MCNSLAEQHPELIHYTSAAGLAGILRSQTLWATHYAYLNDTAEVKHFIKSRLPELLKKLIAQHGGNLEAEQISDFILNSLLPLVEAYIVSFCTVSNGDSLVSHHGLLSQWRGYGQDGGYAIVFDTAGLSQLLEVVANRWKYCCDIFGGDIVYSSDSEEKLQDEFADDLPVIERFFLAHIKGEEWKLENIYFALVKCACRYKHWGFKEENEVRIIVNLHNNEGLKHARTQGMIVNEVQRKHYMHLGNIVPFVELFEGITSLPAKSLPIRRIIVGPSGNPHEQNRRILAAEILLGQQGIKADVSASEIPYIDR
jgi:Protein of unknown function (DUF2971)